MKLSVATLAFTILVLIPSRSHAQSSLKSSLGSSNVEKLLKDELVKFSKGSKFSIKATPEGWKLLKKLVENTASPTGFIAADRFARDGFDEFLKDYAKFWSEQNPGAQDLPLDPESLERYYRNRRDSCGESPCKVPPCCGNGVQCSSCSQNNDKDFDQMWQDLLRDPPATKRHLMKKQ